MGVAVVLGIGLALIGLAPSLPVALAIIGVMGVLIGFINVQAIAWLQSRIADDLRGRVMSLVTLGSVGLAPVSLAIAGALVDLGAVTLTFLAAGAIVIAAALAGIAWGVPTRWCGRRRRPPRIGPRERSRRYDPRPVVGRLGHLPDLPPQLRRCERRRHRRPRGILERLDHLAGTDASLGVDAIWLSPIYPSPQHDFGYDISDYTDVAAEYGTLADLDALIAACHARGLRFLLDLVPCHTSIEHPWFVETRSSRDEREAGLVHLGRPGAATADPRRTGRRRSAAAPGNGTRPPASTTSTRSTRSSRT